MTHRALLLPLLLALPLRAEEPASPAVQVIDVDALEAEWKEFATRFEQVRKGALPLEEFRQHYQQRALAKGTKRQQAIAAYFYGFVLSNVVPQVQGKENKEAKRELQRAIDLEPGLLDAYSELALVAARAGDRTEAERFLTLALQIDRGYVRAVVLLAEMAMRARELERAKALFVQSLEIKPMLEAFGGLVNVNTQLFLKSFDEKDKERFAQEALLAADAIVTLEPDNTTLRLAKAKVFLDLGRVKEAIDYLEDLVAGGTLKPEAEADALRFLRGIYQKEGSVAGVRSTLERLLKNSTLKPEDRARITSRLKDLNEMKGHAFVRWAIEDAIQVLHNPGVSVEDRLSVLLRLQEFVDPESEALDVKELQPLVLQAWRECFRTLVDGPPELVVAQLRALRNGRPPPRLMTVLVHFVYPTGKTEEVREEGVRTVAACAGAAAIPSIYYSLQDPSGRVVREVDSQLSILCERRSPLAGGIEAFTDDQRKQALRSWTAYFHSEEGAERLAKAFTQLSGSIVRVNPGLTAAPMIDHAANVILDGDVPWVAWASAYTFLLNYWGKDFRPVERRGKPVEPFERDLVRDAFEKDYARGPEERESLPAPQEKPAPAGAKGK